jgi:hypothetical protein
LRRFWSTIGHVEPARSSRWPAWAVVIAGLLAALVVVAAIGVGILLGRSSPVSTPTTLPTGGGAGAASDPVPAARQFMEAVADERCETVWPLLSEGTQADAGSMAAGCQKVESLITHLRPNRAAVSGSDDSGPLVRVSGPPVPDDGKGDVDVAIPLELKEVFSPS